MTNAEYKKLIHQLDQLHQEMFDQMGLFEISDPRVRLVYRLADIMTPLRNFAPEEGGAPPAACGGPG